MQIKHAVYENLTIQQRIIASVEALARGDEVEKQRLIKSCPKKTYQMNDTAYGEKMETLHDIAMAVECDMRGNAINFFMLYYFEDKLSEDRQTKLFQLMGTSPDNAREILSIRQAWHDLLKDEGIDPTTMEKVNEDVRHHAVKWMIFFAEDIGLEPDPAIVEKYKAVLKNYMGRI